ncbi:MAG: peptidylprolyl isomerase [Proteobacteria bacterium]|nr:peptidylprolyl isomerase [Pseudomonadota bacterium]
MWVSKFKQVTKTLGLCLILVITSWPAISAQDTTSQNPVFARINDRIILYDEFMDIFRAAVRYKYYHGEVPKDELVRFQKQVGRDIVEQVLIHQQAVKQGLNPDREKILAGLAEYDDKYSDSPEWQAQKEENLPRLLEMLERQDLIEQIQSRIRDIEQPDAQAVQAYYKQHPEKFTEPGRFWVSVILLSVPPSSTNQTWLDAEKAANQLIQRMREGEIFADLARSYSSHLSAVNGGDLGYLHQGMLDGDSNTAVNNLKINEISPPVRVLEGFTIFRLNGIQPEKFKSFSEVKQRAANLLYRESQDKAWKEYTGSLIQAADIYVNENIPAAIDEE